MINNEANSVHSNHFIFDDTPQLHRAISLSDAYFGDGASSLVALYKATGKPLLFQNIEMINNISSAEKEEYLHSDMISFATQIIDYEEYKRKYPKANDFWLQYLDTKQLPSFAAFTDFEYGISSLLNAVYQCDERTATAPYLTSSPVKEVTAGFFHAPLRIGERLIFPPLMARKWVFYDLCTNEMTEKEVPLDLYPSKKERAVFGGYVLHDDSILFLPGESGAIAKLNIHTGAITYHKEWYFALKKDVKNVDLGIICSAFSYRGNVVLISRQSNIALELDTKTMKVVNSYRIGAGFFGIMSSAYTPNTGNVYLIKRREPEDTVYRETIVKWNIKTGQYQEFDHLPIHIDSDKTQNALHGFVPWKGSLLALPYQGDAMLRIDMETSEITRLELTPSFHFFDRKSSFYEGWAKDIALPSMWFDVQNESYIAALPYDYSLADINFDTGKISNVRKWKVIGAEEQFLAQGKGSNTVVTENLYYELTDYIADVVENRENKISFCEDNNKQDAHDVMKGLNGNQIYDYCKKLVISDAE